MSSGSQHGAANPGASRYGPGPTTPSAQHNGFNGARSPATGANGNFPRDSNAYSEPPIVSVTDYGSHAPYPNPVDSGNGYRDYEESYYSSPPPDFDALFSGETRPSVMVTGMHDQLPTGKANRVLGLNDPNNLVYENSGFSRNVHFDISTLPEDDVEFNQAEAYARKRRGFLPGFMSFDNAAESVSSFPKKSSKSRLVSKGKMSKNDRWLEWSERMRVEAQIKKEEFVKKQEEVAKNKLPAPIIKARKESVKFVNRDYVPIEEETPLSKAIHAMEQATPAKPGVAVNKQHSRDRCTADQWRKLHAYWEHPLFQKSRPLGYLVAFVAMFAVIPPVMSTRWIKYTIYAKFNFTYTLEENQTYYYIPDLNCSTVDINGTCFHEYWNFSHIEHHGFWFNCTDNITTYSGINDPACTYIKKTVENHVSIGIWDVCYKEMLAGDLLTADDISTRCKYRPHDAPELGLQLSQVLISLTFVLLQFFHEKRAEWQSAIIGLLLFSLSFGFIGSILTTCGVCVGNLSKKVYYYHSAGEIFFVCGLFTMAALIIYPAVLESSESTPSHQFGIGYFLAWGMPLCYFISALCMTLDDIIHYITNQCCVACSKKSQPLTSV